VRILGPLEVERHGSPVALPGKAHLALAWIAGARGPLAVRELDGALWGRNGTHVRVGRRHGILREIDRLLGRGHLLVRSGTVTLDPRGIDVDADRFEGLLGRQAGRREANLAAALALWRGRALPEISGDDPATPQLARLRLQYVAATYELASIRLAGPLAAPAIADLTRLLAEEPDRQPLRLLLAAGLAAGGRRVDALRVLRSTGRPASPGAAPDAAALEQAILNDERDALSAFIARTEPLM